MTKRKALGASALDSVLGGPTPKRAASKAKPTAKPTKKKAPASASAPKKNATPPPDGASKVRATFHIPAALLEEARDCVVALSGPPTHLTLADLATEGLRREIDRLQKKHHGGKTFARRSGELKGGRPVKR